MTQPKKPRKPRAPSAKKPRVAKVKIFTQLANSVAKLCTTDTSRWSNDRSKAHASECPTRVVPIALAVIE